MQCGAITLHQSSQWVRFSDASNDADEPFVAYLSRIIATGESPHPVGDTVAKKILDAVATHKCEDTKREGHLSPMTEEARLAIRQVAQTRLETAASVTVGEASLLHSRANCWLSIVVWMRRDSWSSCAVSSKDETAPCDNHRRQGSLVPKSAMLRRPHRWCGSAKR